MTDFAFRIEADASNALQTEKQVLGGLDKIRERAGGVGSALKAGFAAAGGMALVHQLAEISDKYTELHNRALKFADSGRNVSMVLADQRTLARALHIGVKETIGAYDAVRDATDELNLTYDQQLRLTKTLGEAAALSGKSTEGMADALHGIKVAMETGQDPGRALIGLFKQYPDLADQMTASLGRTRGQLVQMAKDGKLSFDEMTHSLIANTDAIDAKFAKRVPTWGHNWEVLRDELERPIDLQGSIDALMNVDMAIARVVGDTQKRVEQWKALEAKMSARGSHSAQRLTSDELGKVESEAAKVAEANQKRATEAARRHNEALKEQLALAKALLGSETSTERAIREGEQSRAEFRAAVEADAQAEIDAENRAYQSAVEAADTKIRAEQEWRDAVQRSTEEAARAREKFAEEEIRSVEKVREAWAQGLGSIAADLVNMANEGEFSIERLGSALAKLALQMVAIRAGGVYGAALSAFAGGLNLPGHASGTQFMVGGAGGTDQNIVAFRASNNERVTVETPADRRSGKYFGGGGGSGPVSIVNQYQDDPRAIRQSLSGHAGTRVIYNVVRRLPGRTAPRR